MSLISKKVQVVTLLLTGSSYIFGCGGDSGKPFTAPQVEPPVTKNMPDGVKGSLSLLRTDTQSVPQLIKEYLYPTGDFTGPMIILKMIDERIASLSNRAGESERACMSDAVKEYTLAGSLPAGEAMVLKFQCQENLSSESQLAFGLDSEKLYLMERMVRDDGGGVTLATSKLDESEIDIWQVNYQTASKGGNLLHMKSTVSGGLEITTSGNETKGQSGALTCGIHMKSGTDKKYLFVKGSLATPEGCSEEESQCFDAATLTEVEDDLCSAAGLNSFAINSLTSDVAISSLADIAKLVDTKISGFTDFNTDKN